MHLSECYRVPHLTSTSLAAVLPLVTTQQQQQLAPEPVQQQQPKFFRRQGRAGASTHIQVPGLPVTLPRSLIPAGLAAPDSLWGRVLLAGIGAIAAASAIMRLSSSSSEHTRQQGAAGAEAAATAQELAAAEPPRPTALDALLAAIQDARQTAAAAAEGTGGLQAQVQQEGVEVVHVPVRVLAAGLAELQQQQDQQQGELNAQVN